MPTPNLAQLRRAVDLAQQIEKLQGELAGILRVSRPPGLDLVIPAPKEKRTMSRAARAKISKRQRLVGQIRKPYPEKRRRWLWSQLRTSVI